MPMRFSSIAVLSVSLFACTSSTEPTPASSTAKGASSSSSTSQDGASGTSNSGTNTDAPSTSAATLYEAPAGEPCADPGDYTFEAKLDPPDSQCVMGRLVVGLYGQITPPVGDKDLEAKECPAVKAPGTCALTGARCNWEQAEHLSQDGGGFGDTTNGVKVTSKTSFVTYGSEVHTDASGNVTFPKCTWTITAKKK